MSRALQQWLCAAALLVAMVAFGGGIRGTKQQTEAAHAEQRQDRRYRDGKDATAVRVLPGAGPQLNVATGVLTTASGHPITTTRASTKYCQTGGSIDPNQLIASGNAVGNADWNISGSVTATLNAAHGVDGTPTASSVTFTASTSDFIYAHATSAQLTTYTFSVYLWTATGTQTLRLSRTNRASWGPATVSPTLTVTTTPTRYAMSFTTLAGELATDVLIGGEGHTPFAPSAGTVYIWGAKVNLGATAQPFVTPPLVALGNNVPCVEANGLLVEDQATNLALWSQRLDRNPWTIQEESAGTVLTTGATTEAFAPDGTYTATKVVYPASTGAGQANYVSQYVGLSAGTYAFSVYVRGAGTQTFYVALFDGTNPATFATVALTTTWQRVALTLSASTAIYILIGSDTRIGVGGEPPMAAQTVYLWQGQLEAGTVATSPIPTDSSTADRAGDLITIDYSPALKLSKTPSLSVDFIARSPDTLPVMLGVYNGSTDARFLDLNPGVELYMPNGAEDPSVATATTITPGTKYHGVGYLNGTTIFASDTATATATISQAIPPSTTFSTISLGAVGWAITPGASVNGWVSNICVSGHPFGCQ